jgi:hypothetical protein
MLRSTVTVDADGYVCQGDRCVFTIHIASLDTRAKTGISNTRSVSATLGICTERLRVACWIISAKLGISTAPLRLESDACGSRTGTRHSATTTHPGRLRPLWVCADRVQV